MITYKETEKDVISKFETDGDTTTQTLFVKGHVATRIVDDAEEVYEPFQELIDSGIEYEPYIEPEPTPAELKLKGVEIFGVMCSATKEDQWGLSSIESEVTGGMSLPFYFSNGNVLELTPDNFAEFKVAWFTFRSGFFL